MVLCPFQASTVNLETHPEDKELLYPKAACLHSVHFPL